MAITIYYGTNAGGGGNTPLSTDIGTALAATGATAGTGPSTGAFLYGFMDGEQKFRSFYSSSANTITLPTLVQPPVVPTNFYSCGTSGAGVVYQLVQTGSDYGTGTTGFALPGHVHGHPLVRCGLTGRGFAVPVLPGPAVPAPGLHGRQRLRGNVSRISRIA